MSKIIKFLSSLGIKCKYVGSKTLRHYGGASFYNDGYYTADYYEFTYNDVMYSIQHKATGRPQYWLYVNDEIETLRFNQREFVELLKKKLLSNNN